MPTYEPDMGLLFGGEGKEEPHSPLSGSWSILQSDQVPAEDDRITFSISLFVVLITAWLGQSCSYVQIGSSLNILTDPIFGYTL